VTLEEAKAQFHAIAAPRFRTIQVCPKDFPAMQRRSGGAAPATFVGGLTMSERVVEEGQSWASDIIGVLSGVGLYSADDGTGNLNSSPCATTTDSPSRRIA
jgi:hypothetical protein